MVASIVYNFFTSQCCCSNVIGKVAILFIFYKLVSKIWLFFKLYFVSPKLKLAIDFKTYGEWAVVTGSTDGIGKEYAFQLASKGMNVFLISRSFSKLQDTKQEITSKYPQSKVSTLAIDFSQDLNIYENIKKELQDLDIAVLVNNVGTSVETPTTFNDLTHEEVQRISTVNCFSVVFMTKIVLPLMLSKKKGIIINIASISAFFPAPYLSLYAATKSFVRSFSRSLNLEYKEKGIIIQSIAPGLVATKMSKIKKTSLMVPSPSSFVQSALATVGLHTDLTGCLSHELQREIVSLIGDDITSKFFLKEAIKMKERFLANKAKEQKTQ